MTGDGSGPAAAGHLAGMSHGPAVDRLTTRTPLDPAIERVGSLAETLPLAVRDALRGTWLGHPLHPALQVPVGAWLSSTVLDLVAAALPDDVDVVVRAVLGQEALRSPGWGVLAMT